MSDYISRQAAIDAVMDVCKRNTTNAIRAKHAIEELPSADVRENVSGEWIKEPYQGDMSVWRCSACMIAAGVGIWVSYPYCPNCGADMRKEGTT